MPYRLISVLAIALWMSTGLAVAEDKKPEAASAAAAKTDASQPAKAKAGDKAMTKAKAAKPKKKKKEVFTGKKTGINTASKEELMKLPGVTAEVADKIIAGRPYLTKVHLLTKDIISYDIFQKIKARVAADGKAPF